MDIFSLYQAQVANSDQLWNFYAIVAFGLIAFVLGNREVTRTFLVALFLSLGYAGFAIANLRAIYRAQEALIVLAPLVNDSRFHSITIKTYGLSEVVKTHLFIDLVMVAFIWGTWWMRRPQDTNAGRRKISLPDRRQTTRSR